MGDSWIERFPRGLDGKERPQAAGNGDLQDWYWCAVPSSVPASDQNPRWYATRTNSNLWYGTRKILRKTGNIRK